MASKLFALLTAAAAVAFTLRPALADSPGMPSNPNNTPPGGWTNNTPPTGWGGLPPTNAAGTADNGGGNGDHGDHSHHHGPEFIPVPYFVQWSNGSTAGSQPIIINMPAPAPAPQPAGPPPPVPGVDKHPTVERTPAGVDIVRGPGSS